MICLPLLNDAVESVNVRLPVEADKDYPWFDNTTLVGINTCPTYGMIRNVKDLAMPGAGRAMALEAGSASHEFYAAVRVYDLMVYQERLLHAICQGTRLFKEETWINMFAQLSKGEDKLVEGLNFCLQALYGYGYYDDPQDKRRTLSNIEESCIAYYDAWKWNKHPIYIQDEDDETCLVGIEIGMEFVIEFRCYDGSRYTYRYRGRIDGLHRNATNNELIVQENKTGSRLDNAWSMSFLMSHQVTGYCVGSALLAGEPCNKAVVMGMAIPLPRSYDYGGLVNEPVVREKFMVEKWLAWVWDTTRVYEQFKDDVDQATRYTHSCNRYFRPCAMIPYCTADDDERAHILNDELVHTPWDPLADKSKD